MAGAGDSEIQELLEQIHLKEKEEAVRKKHAFWESQPVKQFTEEANDGEGVEEGPVQTLASQDVSQGKPAQIRAAQRARALAPPRSFPKGPKSLEEREGKRPRF